VDLAYGVAKGMEALHAANIVHRDLSARNVLLTEDGTAKVCDFGLSRLVDEFTKKGATMAEGGVPIKWMAPESLATREYSVASDVWSFGILLYEISARNEPFLDMDLIEAAYKIMKDNLRPTLPADTPAILKHLFDLCTEKVAYNRPSFKIIADYFAGALVEGNVEGRVPILPKFTEKSAPERKSLEKKSKTSETKEKSTDMKEKSKEAKEKYNSKEKALEKKDKTPSKELEKSTEKKEKTPSKELEKNTEKKEKTPSKELEKGTEKKEKTPGKDIEKATEKAEKTPSKELEKSTESVKRTEKTPSRELEKSTEKKEKTPSKEFEKSTESLGRSEKKEKNPTKDIDKDKADKTPSKESEKPTEKLEKFPSKEIEKSTEKKEKTPLKDFDKNPDITTSKSAEKSMEKKEKRIEREKKELEKITEKKEKTPSKELEKNTEMIISVKKTDKNEKIPSKEVEKSTEKFTSRSIETSTEKMVKSRSMDKTAESTAVTLLKSQPNSTVEEMKQKVEKVLSKSLQRRKSAERPPKILERRLVTRSIERGHSEDTPPKSVDKSLPIEKNTVQKDTADANPKLEFEKQMTLQGSWDIDTAGGSVEFPCWRINPQYALQLTSSSKIKLTLGLHAMAKQGGKLPKIGFYVFKALIGKKRKIGADEFVALPNFKSAQEVTRTLELEQGIYIIMGATEQPHIHGDFTITLHYSGSGITFEPVEEWSFAQVTGAWTNKECGGSKTKSNPLPWETNPKYYFTLPKKSKMICLLFLDKKDADQGTRIGLYIYLKQGGKLVLLTESDFTEDESIRRLGLEANEYVIVPTTFDSGVLANYTLNMYTEYPLGKLKHVSAVNKVKKKNVDT